MKVETQGKKILFFDATFLQFAHDLRGVPQVIIQLIRFLESESNSPSLAFSFPPIIYLVTQRGWTQFLEPLGIPENRIEIIKAWPLIRRLERFHGLGSSWRYKKFKNRALGFIHPEPRTLVSFDIPQWVLFYDFISIESQSTGEAIAWSRQFYFQQKLQLAKNATSIAAISSYTAKRISQLLPQINSEKIKTLHLGLRESMNSELKPVRKLAERLELLYVGSFDKRKNVARLIENLSVVISKRTAKLHLAGWISPERKDSFNLLVQKLPNNVSVVFHGLVSETELKNLYLQAHFLLFPSHFEGFGLPLIEAMSFGLPICAFNNSAIPEVAGEAACIAENDDFGAWGKEIDRACDSDGFYLQWSEAAFARAQYFTEANMKTRYLNHFYDFVKKAMAIA